MKGIHMLRNYRTYALLLLLTIALLGCETLKGMIAPLHTPVTVADEDSAVRAFRLARWTIDEANVDLTVFNKAIESRIDAKTITKARAQEYKNKSVEFGEQVDLAEKGLAIGNLNDARLEAEAIRGLILLLQQELNR